MQDVNEYFRLSAEQIEKFGDQFGPELDDVAERLAAVIQKGSAIFIAGNGGSAADAQHFAAELVGRFDIDRPAMRAVALTTDTSILTSVGNDYGYEDIFRRQLEGLARPDDALLAITTSGRSANILRVLAWARENGVVTFGLYGAGGGEAANITDHPLIVDNYRTPLIQQVHSVIIHYLCGYIEEKVHGG